MRKTVAVLVLLCMISLCLAGCRKTAGLADALAAVEAQAGAIQISLEQDALTQAEMNQKSAELCALWDAALNRMLEQAKKTLPAAEYEQLTAEQKTWLEARTLATEAAGKDFAGGSMQALVVNMETARITEERVRKLFERLK